jgi:hypothetical protein
VRRRPRRIVTRVPLTASSQTVAVQQGHGT